MREILKKAITLIEDTPTSFYQDINYSPVYLFTTENIRGMMNNLDIKDKNILTVSASGDQIFNMLLSGTNKIDSYDVSYFTKYYYYLKESAIKTLSYDEFFDFFFPSKYRFKNKVFDNKLFLDILDNIQDNEAKYFWMVLFNRYGGNHLYYSNLFIQNYYPKKTYIECNNYLYNEDNYMELRNRLNSYQYHFLWMNIFKDISNIYCKKYDFIYLSNILDRLYCKNELEFVLKTKEIILNLKNHLVENGTLGICYLYFYLEDYWETLDNRKLNSYGLRLKYFQDDDYYYQSFNGISSIKREFGKESDALMMILKKDK